MVGGGFPPVLRGALLRPLGRHRASSREPGSWPSTQARSWHFLYRPRRTTLESFNWKGFVMSNRIHAAVPITVALVFHSSSGHTARQAEAVRRGIERVTGASVLYLRQTRLKAVWMISNLQTRSSSAPRPTWEACPDRSKPSWIDVKILLYGRLEGQDRGRLHKLGVTVWGQARNTDPIRHLRGTTSHALGQSRSSTGNNSTYGSDQDLNRLGFWLGAAASRTPIKGLTLRHPNPIF